MMAAAPAFALLLAALVGPDDFHAGPVITDYGKVATIESDQPLPAAARWKHSFDLAKAEKATLNRGLDSAARFVNMMAEAGISAPRLKVAVVIHGPATFDVTNAARYGAKYDGAENPNAALVAALIDAGVDVWVCGQSAAYQDVAKSDLLPGVKMAISAITAHAELQRQGYSINPF